MLSTLKPVVFIALLSASAFASPHEARSARHHAIAARQPLTGVQLNPPAVDVQPVKSKKAKRKVCRPRKTTSLLAATSTSVSTTVAATSSSSSVESSPSSTESSTSSKTTEKSSSSTKVDTTSSTPTSTVEKTTSSTSATPTSTVEKTTSSTSVTPTSTVEKTTSSTHSEEPKTTQAPPPPPETTTQKPTSTSTSKEVTTTSQSDNNNNSGNGGYVPAQGSQSFLFGQQTGDATFYDTGLTACGQTFSNSDYIVAVSELLFDTFPGAGANPNLNPVCGKKIRASMPGGGSVEVTVQDRCTGCSLTSLDFTPDAFNHLGAQSQGRLHGMTWEWIP